MIKETIKWKLVTRLCIDSLLLISCLEDSQSGRETNQVHSHLPIEECISLADCFHLLDTREMTNGMHRSNIKERKSYAQYMKLMLLVSRFLSSGDRSCSSLRCGCYYVSCLTSRYELWLHQRGDRESEPNEFGFDVPFVLKVDVRQGKEEYGVTLFFIR